MSQFQLGWLSGVVGMIVGGVLFKFIDALLDAL